MLGQERKRSREGERRCRVLEMDACAGVTVTYSTLLLWAKVADGSEQVRDISQWRDAD